MNHTETNFDILNYVFLKPYSHWAVVWSFNELFRSSELLDFGELVESCEVSLPGGIALNHFGGGLQFIVHCGQSFQKISKKEINSKWFVAEQEWLGAKLLS
jgi:hypothetical protein